MKFNLIWHIIQHFEWNGKSCENWLSMLKQSKQQETEEQKTIEFEN